jgi:protein TonB
MKRRLRFTIYHGFAASLALHSALALPFAVHSWALAPEEPPTLVIDLQGVVADNQAVQKVLQETKGEAKPDEANIASPPAEAATTSEAQPREVTADEAEAATPPAPMPVPSPPKVEQKSVAVGTNNIAGVEEQQKAETVKTDPQEIDPFADYVKLLTKKVQANLVYPDQARRAGLQGIATVSFAILNDGQIRPETLKIIESSGQPKLDASALKTIRASVPFAPPPKEMTVAIAVAFGRKH